jgi:hypothetical protein
MATGDGSGTWGTTTNTNLELIAEAFSYGTEVITTNADTHTTTIADGATDPGRSLYLKYTGTLDSACTITIGPNTVSKVWIIENGTSGSQNIILSQGSGANITIPAGDTKVVYSDGAGAGAAFVDAFASLSVVDLKVQDDLTVTDAALVTGVLTTTATQVATGGITSGSDIISDTDSTDSLGSTGVRWLKGWFDTLTAGTLTVGSGSVTDSSGAISFGDENLTTTGIVTAAGTSVFTNLDISGDIDVDGTTNLDVVDIDGAVDMASTLTMSAGGTISAGGANDLVLNAGASGTPDIYLQSGGATKVKIEGSNGNVGIGTTSPDQLLQLGSETYAANAIIKTQVDGSDVGDFDAGLHMRSHNDDFGGSIVLESRLATNDIVNFKYHNNSSAGATAMAIDATNGNVGIGTTAPNAPLTIQTESGTGSKAGLRINNPFGFADVNTGCEIIFSQDRSSAEDFKMAAIVSGQGGAGSSSAGHLSFFTRNASAIAEKVRITSGGILLVGTTSVDPATVDGCAFYPQGTGHFTRASDYVLYCNRRSNDGDIVIFAQDGSNEGSISVSGATVSYNGFSGNHETSGISTDTEIGTVCSTIDELDTYTSGTKEGQTRADHAKIKVSDTVGDTRVYGVLTSYSETDNKPVVASVGIGSIKVTGACSGGDLLESNGDGTAKVQSDDIVRSKTIGKVTIGNSDTGVKLVSCVLYCG